MDLVNVSRPKSNWSLFSSHGLLESLESIVCMLVRSLLPSSNCCCLSLHCWQQVSERAVVRASTVLVSPGAVQGRQFMAGLLPHHFGGSLTRSCSQLTVS